MNTTKDFFQPYSSVGRRFLLFITLALLSLGLPLAAAQAGRVTQQWLLDDDVRGWVPTQRLTAHGNQAQLRLQMVPCTLCRLGDTMQIRVTSREDGFLFLLDINSAGQLTRIFPNKYTKPQSSRRGLSRIPSKYNKSPLRPGYVKAGQTVIIPDDNYGFDFTATEPVGKGLVVALLVEQDFVYNVALPDEFETIQATEAYATLQRLNKYLNEMLETDDNIGRPVRWSITTLDYEITR